MDLINEDMTIHEVLDMDPATGDIFVEHGMHCITCPFSVSESIREASMVHGLDCDALIAALNEYFDNKKA